MIALLCGGKAPQKRALFVADLRREVMAAARNEAELPWAGGWVFLAGLVVAVVGGMFA